MSATREREALLVIDVQMHLLESPSAHDAEGVVARIIKLIERARREGVEVVFVQHDGAEGGPMAVDTPGWQLHPSVIPTDTDVVVHKRASDSFFETDLDSRLRERGVARIYVTGCKTEYCIDTTSRRATTLGYDVTLVADCHTTTSNTILSAREVIRHHNETLDEFGNDAHEIAVVDSSALRFAGSKHDQ